MYGSWEVIDILNDFYEPTGKKYVLQEIDGYFSNSATASSDCKVYVMLLKGDNDRLTGKIVIDEYCDNTPDMTLNEYGSPAKRGSKIIGIMHFRLAGNRTGWNPSRIDFSVLDYLSL